MNLQTRAAVAKARPRGRCLEFPDGTVYVITEPAERSGGRVFEMETVLVPDGGAPPPHAHPHQHEHFEVLEGALKLPALQAIRQGDEDLVAQQIIHADYHNHEAAADRPSGPEGFKETARRLREAFDEVRIEPLDFIASRDKVTVRVTFSGRHVGPFAGLPITGRESRSSTRTSSGSLTASSSSTGPTAMTPA